MAAIMTAQERDEVSKIFELSVQIPSNTRQFIIGYAQAVIDVMPQEGEDNDRKASY